MPGPERRGTPRWDARAERWVYDVPTGPAPGRDPQPAADGVGPGLGLPPAWDVGPEPGPTARRVPPPRPAAPTRAVPRGGRARPPRARPRSRGGAGCPPSRRC
ncbi:hypothetical protein ACN20G_08805 [Streptomyces sp. BI20]|uniref:hypothetical protein n=1 Tax=Streptomyces sp. BI20 TaxID=3403460 RepID=UPI003C7713F4